MLPKIFFFVLFGHIAALVMLFFSQKTAHFSTPKKMIVSTVVMKNPVHEKTIRKEDNKIKKDGQKIIEKKVRETIAQNKKNSLDKKVKSPEKGNKEEKKNLRENHNVVKEISKKSSAKNDTKDRKKEIPKKESLDLIDQLSNFDKINDVSSRPKAENLHVPTLGSLKVPSINIDEESQSDAEMGLQNVLIEHFRKNLSLPEYGEVKIKLTLNADGTIENVSVISSKSKKNEEYLKNTLPNLTFPWFNAYLPNEKNLVLTISFLNEI